MSWRQGTSYHVAYLHAQQHNAAQRCSISDVVARHAYLLTKTIPHRRGQFSAKIVRAKTKVLGRALEQEYTKHVQTKERVEWAHAKLKTSNEKKGKERFSIRNKYPPMTVKNYNTTYIASIDCDAKKVFQGRLLHNMLYVTKSLTAPTKSKPSVDVTQTLDEQNNEMYE